MHPFRRRSYTVHRSLSQQPRQSQESDSRDCYPPCMFNSGSYKYRQFDREPRIYSKHLRPIGSGLFKHFVSHPRTHRIIDDLPRRTDTLAIQRHYGKIKKNKPKRRDIRPIRTKVALAVLQRTNAAESECHSVRPHEIQCGWGPWILYSTRAASLAK